MLAEEVWATVFFLATTVLAFTSGKLILGVGFVFLEEATGFFLELVVLDFSVVFFFLVGFVFLLPVINEPLGSVRFIGLLVAVCSLADPEKGWQKVNRQDIKKTKITVNIQGFMTFVLVYTVKERNNIDLFTI
jgi:hypothetical protein